MTTQQDTDMTELTVVHIDYNEASERIGYLIYTGTLDAIIPTKTAKRRFTKAGYTTVKDVTEAMIPTIAIEGSKPLEPFDKIMCVQGIKAILDEGYAISEDVVVISHSKYFNRVIKEYFHSWLESRFKLSTGDDTPEADIFRYLYSDACPYNITFLPGDEIMLGDSIARVFSHADQTGTYHREVFGTDYRKSRLIVSKLLSLPYIIHDKINNKQGVYFTTQCKDVTLIGRNSPSILYGVIITTICEDIDVIISRCSELLDNSVICINYKNINTPDIRTLFKDHDVSDVTTRKGFNRVVVRDKLIANNVVPMNLVPKALDIFNALYLARDNEGTDITDTFYDENGKFRNELRGSGVSVKYRGLTGRIKNHVWGRDIPPLNTLGSLSGKNVKVVQTYISHEHAMRPLFIITSDEGTAIYSAWFYNIVRDKK